MGNALAALDRWARSWRRDTWVLVVWTLVVAGVYLWSQAQLASWCDNAPDQAACRTLDFWAGPAFVLGPVAFFWLAYLIVWTMFRIWSLLRRPAEPRDRPAWGAYAFGCAVALALFSAFTVATTLLSTSALP